MADRDVTLLRLPEGSPLTDPRVLRFLQFIAGLSVGGIAQLLGFLDLIASIQQGSLELFARFLADPVAFVQSILLTPILNLVFGIATSIIDALLVAAFGVDRTPGGTEPGLLDFPFVGVGAFASFVQQGALEVVASVAAFNAGVQASLEPLGVFAFPVVVLVVGVEIVVAGALLFVVGRATKFGIPLLE